MGKGALRRTPILGISREVIAIVAVARHAIFGTTSASSALTISLSREKHIILLVLSVALGKRDSFMRFGDGDPDPEHIIGSALEWYRRHPNGSVGA